MTHDLKTWKEYFEEIWEGRKTFEVRKNDRNFQVGDTLNLVEMDLGGYGMTDHDLSRFPTGRTIQAEVTYILKGGLFGIEEGYVVMSIEIENKYP